MPNGFHAVSGSRRLRNLALVDRVQELPSLRNREPTFAHGNGWTEVKKKVVNGALPSVRVDERAASAAGALDTLDAVPKAQRRRTSRFERCPTSRHAPRRRQRRG